MGEAILAAMLASQCLSVYASQEAGGRSSDELGMSQIGQGESDLLCGKSGSGNGVWQDGVGSLLQEAIGMWRRDLARHGLKLSVPGDRSVWEVGNRLFARGWLGLVMGGWAALGAVGTLACLSWGMPWAAAGVFGWIPWMIVGLGIVHTIRLLCQRRAPRESEHDFLEHCSNQVPRHVALAVRGVIARVYGVPTDIIRAEDGGWSLSRFMEAATVAEVVGALEECPVIRWKGGELWDRMWPLPRSVAELAERMA